MAETKKRDEAPETEQTITVTPSILKTLIRDGVAEILSSKTHDEGMAERMRTMRGQDRPPPPEELVACRSPLTGSTMMVRIVKSRTTPGGRVVEILDYVKPAGWDVHVEDGGLYSGQREWMTPPLPGRPLEKGQHAYRHWVYSTFWLADWNAMSGKPASFLAQWRLPAVEKAAE